LKTFCKSGFDSPEEGRTRGVEYDFLFDDGQSVILLDNTAVTERGSLHINSELGIAAALEAKRLAEKHGKDFFTCDDLVKITGFGTNNIRQLMCSDEFPYVQVGNRKAVSVIAFALRSLKCGLCG